MPRGQQPPEPAESVKRGRRLASAVGSGPTFISLHVPRRRPPPARAGYGRGPRRRSPWQAGQTATAVPSTDAAPPISSLGAADPTFAQLVRQRPPFQLGQTKPCSSRRRQRVLLRDFANNAIAARPTWTAGCTTCCPLHPSANRPSSATTRPAALARANWVAANSSIAPSTPASPNLGQCGHHRLPEPLSVIGQMLGAGQRADPAADDHRLR